MLKEFCKITYYGIVMVVLLSGCSNNSSISSNLSNTAGVNKQTDKAIVFRLAENQPENYPTTLGDKEFVRLVSERTDGRIKIEVYADGELGNEESVVEKIQFGAVDFARVSIAPLAEAEKFLEVLMLPYLYRDREHMFKVLDGPIGEDMLSKLIPDGFMGLSWYDAGARSFYNTKKEIETPADMKDMKIRVQGTTLMKDLVTALGAAPSAMVYGDVYSALQTGVIDGAENNWPSFEASRHYEIAKYLTINEHSRIPELLLSSKISMDKLSSEDLKIIRNAAKEAALYERAEWLKREEISKKKVESYGVKITYLPSKDEFKEKVQYMYDRYKKDYKEIIDQILNTK